MNATPRVIYGWAKAGTFFKAFTHIDKESGIPRPALWLTFGLSIFWTLPFPSGNSSLAWYRQPVLSYAIAPVTAAGLRRNAPDLPRPFRVRLRHHRPDIVYDLGADSLLVRLEYALMVTGAANRDVCRLRDVQG